MVLNREQAMAQGEIIRKAEDLGSLIRKRRKRFGYTQEEMADMMECSPRLIGEMERGRGTVGIDKMLDYALSLGIDVVAFER